jgi:RNA polymerase sigma-70 factor (sigma-E family)
LAVTEQASKDFAEFVRIRSGRLLRFAFWMTGSWPDAEDLVQDSLAKAYLRWQQIEQPDAYLHRLVVNAARSWYRRRRAEVLTAVPPELLAGAAGPEAVVARCTLVAALARLPRRQRAVVVLRYCLDLSERDVAALLGCSAGTVKSQASRALTKLRADPALWPDEPASEEQEGRPG